MRKYRERETGTGRFRAAVEASSGVKPSRNAWTRIKQGNVYRCIAIGIESGIHILEDHSPDRFDTYTFKIGFTNTYVRNPRLQPRNHPVHFTGKRPVAPIGYQVPVHRLLPYPDPTRNIGARIIHT